MAIGPRTQQAGDKDRPYWVYVWQGDLSGGGSFGAQGGWTRYDAGIPPREVNFSRNESTIRCIRNCSPARGTGTSSCDVNFEVNYHEGNPNNVTTDIRLAQGLDYVVHKLTLTGNPGEGSRQVLASNIDNSRVEPIYQALPSEVIVSAPILNIECTYDVNGQLPGCFIESPETCQVTISDRSGVIFQQTYFGRPDIETSSEYLNVE